MHTVKEIEMLAAKLDHLMKRLDDQEKDIRQRTVKALDSHKTCVVCGNTGHSGSNRRINSELHNLSTTSFHYLRRSVVLLLTSVPLSFASSATSCRPITLALLVLASSVVCLRCASDGDGCPRW